MIVASDLNGTLTVGSPILAVVNWIKINQPEYYPGMYKTRVLLSYLQVRFGRKSLTQWADKMMREVVALIQDPDQDTVHQIMNCVVEEELWPKRRKKAVKLLQDFHQEGAGIILVSAAYQPAVELFARKIARERTIAIGTPIYITNNKLTLAETLTTGEEKLKRLKKITGNQPLDIAMGDTISDLPLLKIAKQPLVVYPDRGLRKHAQSKGWRIIE